MTIWSGVTPISSSSSRVRNCWRSGRKPCGVPLDRKMVARLPPQAAQGAGHQLAVQPLVRQEAPARRLVALRGVEHAAQQPGHVDIADGVRRRRGGRGRMRHALPHIEARTAPRLQVAQRHQPLVGLHHREARNPLLGGQLPDRRHAHAGPEHPFVDAQPRPFGQLLDQRHLGRGNRVRQPFVAGRRHHQPQGPCAACRTCAASAILAVWPGVPALVRFAAFHVVLPQLY